MALTFVKAHLASIFACIVILSVTPDMVIGLLLCRTTNSLIVVTDYLILLLTDKINYS